MRIAVRQRFAQSCRMLFTRTTEWAGRDPFGIDYLRVVGGRSPVAITLGDNFMNNFKSIRNYAATLIAIVAGSISAFGNGPTNDNFANAEVLTGMRVSVVRSNVDATKEVGEPNHASNVGGKSVWFKWVASERATVVFSTVRTVDNLDTTIHVYTGSGLDSLSSSVSNNDISGPVNKRSAARHFVRPGDVYYIAVDGNNPGTEAASGTFRLDIKPALNFQGSDYDGDGRTDVSVFRPSDGKWYIYYSATEQMGIYTYGTQGDIPVSASRTNGTNQPTLFRPSTGEWFGYHHSNPTVKTWGMAGDIPLSETFGGESASVYTVFRPSDGTWYMSDHIGTPRYYRFGLAGDVPVPGRYTPDMHADVAVFRPSNGYWYILRRVNGDPGQDSFLAVPFGMAGDKPEPGDYDGDGLLDLSIYRPSTGTWWILRSSDNQTQAIQCGLSDHIPTTGDFRFDAAVFRPSNGYWSSSHSTIFSFEGSAVVAALRSTRYRPLSVEIQKRRRSRDSST
jgi:hypothetical protein